MCVFIMENYLFVCEENREKMRGNWPREIERRKTYRKCGFFYRKIEREIDDNFSN